MAAFIGSYIILCVCVFDVVEEIGKMNSLLLQKQRELVVAVSKAEELSKQLETVKNGQTDMLHNNQSSVGELDRLYRELQVKFETLIWRQKLGQNCLERVM